MATFGTLYGVELDRELGSADRVQLFTTARRKAAINAGQLEFSERTECFVRQASVAIVDGTQEYDLESTITDFGGLSTQGVSIKIVGSQTRYIEGGGLRVTTSERLSHEDHGWRAWSAGQPHAVYLRRDGGAVTLGFHPTPDVGAGETWTAIVSYVAIPPDMVDDADVPFTISANALSSLSPYHRALVHFAAYDLEKLRKDPSRGEMQLKLFDSYVERYLASMQPKGGQTIRFVKSYRRPAVRVMDPRVWP